MSRPVAEAGNFASARALARDPLGALSRLALRGDVVRFQWDGCPVWMLNHPDGVVDVLQNRQKAFVRGGGPKRLARLLGNGLLRSQGETHRRQRRLAQSAFLPQLQDHYGEIVIRHAGKWATKVARGGVVDFHREVMGLTLSIVCDAFFGTEIHAETRDVGRAVSSAIRALPDGGNALTDIVRQYRFGSAVSRLDGLIHRFIEQGGDSPSLLTALLKSRDPEDGGAMDGAALRDELMTLLIAGHETTASALAWAFHLLSKDPMRQEAWRAEIARVVGEGPLVPGHAEVLPYTRGVFAEALRLYPPAWVLFRRAIEKVEVFGLEIPRGGHVCLSPYTMGRDGRFFDDPTGFRPERWTADFEARLPRGAFFPFGLGNRRCLGETFAWNEAILSLACVGRRARFSPSRRSVREAALFTLRPKRGVFLRVSEALGA